MKHFKTSYAAWSCAAALASFATLYNLLPFATMLDLATSLSFAAAFAALLRYARDAFWAFRSGRKSGELIVVALFSLFFVLTAQRGWVWFTQANSLPNGQRPDWLLNHPVSVFIPWMLSWALGLALFAPDIGSPDVSTKPSLVRSTLLFMAGAAAGFVLANSMRPAMAPGAAVVINGRAVCSDDMPVWGSSRHVYHLPSSPYRKQIRSGWCFRSVHDAEAAGFRPAR